MSNLQLRVTPPVWPLHFKDADKTEAAQKIDQCAKWLHSQGYAIVSVQAAPRNPRVIIRNTPLCEALEGAVRRYERGPQGERRYWVAVRFGCEVRWTEQQTEGDTK